MKYFYITCGAAEPRITSLIGTGFLDGESLDSCHDAFIDEGGKSCVSDYQFGKAEVLGKKATIKIRYHLADWRKLYTKLYLVQEDGAWKVDDLEVWGDAKGFGVDPGVDGFGESFKSLKLSLMRELQAK